jgi:hypothetical protein
MTLIILPLVAQYILNALYFIHTTFRDIVTDLNEYSPIMDKIELMIESTRDVIASKLTCSSFGGNKSHDYGITRQGADKCVEYCSMDTPFVCLGMVWRFHILYSKLMITFKKLPKRRNSMLYNHEYVYCSVHYENGLCMFSGLVCNLL